MTTVLRVEGLKKHFPVRRGLLQRVTGSVKAVDGVSFGIEAGETPCLVGESGCGKSTVGKTILRLQEPTAGRIWLGDTDVTGLSEEQMLVHRRQVQMVFQGWAFPFTEDPSQVPAWALERLAVYTEGGFIEQIGPRIADYWSVLGSIALLGVPQIMALFLLGALAGRLGWLARPQRHPRLWRAAIWIGLGALPFAAAGAWLNFVTMRDSPGDPTSVGYALQNLGSLAACLYVAAFVAQQQRPVVRRCIGWLAPAGRMPLTNYLAQSIAMGLLLSGWGLGLGQSLSRVELALLAIAFAAAQLIASRAWIARFGQGPLEALWRRATYGAQR